MDRIEVVSFDMEGTLVDTTFSNLVWETDIPRLYAEKNGLSLERAREIVMEEYRNIGDERIEWYDVGYWFRRLGLPGDWRQLLDKRRDARRAYPEVRGVLERLGRDYELIVVSNTIREFLDVQLGDLSRHFTHVFSAPSDFGEVKKTGGFFEKICGRLGVEPSKMAHVGDHPRFDYEVPNLIGIHAYYLDRTGAAKGNHVVVNLWEFKEKLCGSQV